MPTPAAGGGPHSRRHGGSPTGDEGGRPAALAGLVGQRGLGGGRRRHRDGGDVLGGGIVQGAPPSRCCGRSHAPLPVAGGTLAGVAVAETTPCREADTLCLYHFDLHEAL